MLQLKDLNNHQLSTICEVHNAESTGTNVELQHRIHCRKFSPFLLQYYTIASSRLSLPRSAIDHGFEWIDQHRS